MRVMVVGSGAREHAIAWKVKKSPLVSALYVAPGNPGTAELGKNVPISADSIKDLARFAEAETIDLTIVGPEQPLALGIADLFRQQGLLCFGPTMAAARVETSKVYSKGLMERLCVPTGRHQSFADYEDARAYVKKQGTPIVLKADGLAAGKGVVVARTEKEAEAGLLSMMKQRAFGEAGSRVVIEEFLEGQEVSLLAICSGRSYAVLPSSQDHKAAYDNDEGPNTGGMGAYSPVPVFDDRILSTVRDRMIEPILWALEREGNPYLGTMFLGLILTREGPKVLEINARLGDPETQAVLPIVDVDLVELMLAAVKGDFRIHEPKATGSAACVVLASGGYPGSYKKDIPIRGLDRARSPKNVEVFHAGTKESGKELLTNGGRVLSVTAWGKDLESALEDAYKAVSLVEFEGIHYRKDIGRKALNRE